MKKRILISAGESSGDLHASNLIKELLSCNSNIEFFGIGCNKMESLGVHLLERMDKHAIVGVWEVLANINFIRNLFKTFSKEVKRTPVDLAILVDYPGFNLLLAKMLNKHNIPCIYYITPQIWAWGKWRINTMKKFIKKALVILNFEESLYAKAGLDATFVGHPLLDEPYNLIPSKEARGSLGLKPDKFTIALLPGSRLMEIKRMLPVLIKTAILIKQKMDVQFIISKSQNTDEGIYRESLGGFDPLLIEGDIYTTLSAADFVLTASGTVTLQIALAEKPMAIIYITSMLTYLLAELFVKRPIGLVNIIAGKQIVPELIQLDAKPKRLAATALDLISSNGKMDKMRADLRRVKETLGRPGASKRAAGIVNNFLKK